MSGKKFDTTAYVFKTDIAVIEKWVEKMCCDLDDPDVEWPSKQEQDWLAVWLRDLNFYKCNGLTHTLISAQESAVLGLTPPKKSKTKPKSSKTTRGKSK